LAQVTINSATETTLNGTSDSLLRILEVPVHNSVCTPTILSDDICGFPLTAVYYTVTILTSDVVCRVTWRSCRKNGRWRNCQLFQY
jgi:hypothetical protein